jgi:phage baseplate assembly protein V
MNAIGRAAAHLSRRLRLMVSRGVITLVNDALKMQGVQVQLLADEVKDNLERFQNYGFTSHPHAGAEGVVVFAGGSRDHGLVIVVDDRRYRLKGLQAGEVALYTDEGDKIVLKRGNVIEVTAAVKVRMVTPLLEVTGRIEAGGDIRDTVATNANTMAGMRTIYDTHTHNDPQGGTVDVPNQQM